MRSPKPMSVAEFQAFNGEYLKPLHEWGCRIDKVNAPARSNIAPITEVPTESMFYAFTYTVAEEGSSGDYLISGYPEIKRDASGSRTFGGRDVSLKGLDAKARYVMQELRDRVSALKCDWGGVTGCQVYTVHDFRPVLETVFSELGLSQIGTAWFPGWPPVNDMEFEVDSRRSGRGIGRLSAITDLGGSGGAGAAEAMMLTMVPCSLLFCRRCMNARPVAVICHASGVRMIKPEEKTSILGASAASSRS
ncbi:MAG: hypothetical protein EOP21_15420 [Hyphomicrobiales bacterium]|nr:MAG: hypothetical protein EOP21_15420 [Hyphomicrobiales bacterium]